MHVDSWFAGGVLSIAVCALFFFVMVMGAALQEGCTHCSTSMQVVLMIACVCWLLCVAVQDGMVYHHEVLEHGDYSQRQQVVRWKRRFPFAFLSDREYTIARREFREHREQDGSIYACTKVRDESAADCSMRGC
jgi:hypothetical protein